MTATERHGRVLALTGALTGALAGVGPGLTLAVSVVLGLGLGPTLIRLLGLVPTLAPASRVLLGLGLGLVPALARNGTLALVPAFVLVLRAPLDLVLGFVLAPVGLLLFARLPALTLVLALALALAPALVFVRAPALIRLLIRTLALTPPLGVLAVLTGLVVLALLGRAGVQAGCLAGPSGVPQRRQDAVGAGRAALPLRESGAVRTVIPRCGTRGRCGQHEAGRGQDGHSGDCRGRRDSTGSPPAARLGGGKRLLRVIHEGRKHQIRQFTSCATTVPTPCSAVIPPFGS